MAIGNRISYEMMHDVKVIGACMKAQVPGMWDQLASWKHPQWEILVEVWNSLKVLS